MNTITQPETTYEVQSRYYPNDFTTSTTSTFGRLEFAREQILARSCQYPDLDFRILKVTTTKEVIE